MYLFVFRRKVPKGSGQFHYLTLFSEFWHDAERIVASIPGTGHGNKWTGRRVGLPVSGVEPGVVTQAREGEALKVVRIVEGVNYSSAPDYAA